MCLYFKYKEQCIEDECGVTSIEGKAVGYIIYCDQILEGSNKQDRLAVISMLKAFLTQLKELPYIITVTVQSDNAGCYHSKKLLLLLAILNGCNKIKVTCYIHTETQDGKGLIDAHSAKGTAHLEKFMKTSQQNKIRVIATAKGLAATLAWGGGIQITLDRKKLRAIIAKVAKEAKAYFARCNDMFYFQCKSDHM